MIHLMHELQVATIEARRRMGDPTLGVAVRSGWFVVQYIVPQPDGSATITNLSDYGTASEAVAFLNNL